MSRINLSAKIATMGISYAAGAVEVDVRDYVIWLIRQPPMTRLAQINQTDAIEAARLLWNCAPSSGDAAALQGLALALAEIAIRYGHGKMGTPRRCRKVLVDAEPVLGKSGICKLAICAVAKIEADYPKSVAVPADYWVYHSNAGHVMGVLKRPGRKAVENDISWRLAVAVDGLKESGCPNHLAVLAQLLCEVTKKEWSVQRIESRLNKNSIPVRAGWPETVWKERFWAERNPGYWDTKQPEAQPFRLIWHGRKGRMPPGRSIV